MPPFGFGLYTAIRNNPALQWAVGIGAALIALLTWDKFRTERIKREARAKAEKRAELQSKAILKEMEEDIDETVEAADRAAERVPDDVDSSSVPDALRRFLRRSEPIDGGS
jgi:hypothetical protein